MKPIPFLLCLMSFLGCKAADFRSVDANTFAQIIEDTTVVRLDVRTANEYAVTAARRCQPPQRGGQGFYFFFLPFSVNI